MKTNKNSPLKGNDQNSSSPLKGQRSISSVKGSITGILKKNYSSY